MKVCVLGLGYVGLNLAIALSKSGFEVHGIDKSASRSEAIRNGRVPESDCDPIELRSAIERGLTVEGSIDVMASFDAILVAVPTPANAKGEPDYTFVESASSEVIDYVLGSSRETLIVLESTVGPSTTRKFFLEKLESKGKMLGRDFLLAYSPERVDPGSKTWNLTNTPKVVAGFDEESTNAAVNLYSQICEQVVSSFDVEAAEASKLIENTFRQLNIAFVNELHELLSESGVDAWESLRLSATKPFGFMPFSPGPGVGGHCIPIDPLFLDDFLSHRAGYGSRLLRVAQEINLSTPIRHASKFVEKFGLSGLNKEDGSVAVYGIAFKEGVQDTRETPVVPIIRAREESGFKVELLDPLVNSLDLDGIKRDVHKTPRAELIGAIILHQIEPGSLATYLAEGAVIHNTRGR